MNRTTIVAVCCWLAAAVGAPAQEPPPPAPAKAQADPIDELVTRMKAAEQALRSLVLELETSGAFGGGGTFKTKGTLRVLRGTQPATHTRMEFEFDDGLRGVSETAQTAAGIVLYEDDPANGAIFVELDPKLVADLEWAGEVLDADGVPGMKDRRAQAPLGSTMVAHTKAHFELTIDAARTERNGEAGTWLTGRRKAGLDVQDTDLPVADTATLFVRAKDHALLEAQFRQGDQRVHTLVVTKLEIGVPLAPKQLQVDGGGLRLGPVQSHKPLHTTIEQTLNEAERKSGKLRPSKH
jgi:hypothetical protein